MSVPRNVAKIIQDHVTFELECIDRMYLNVYVPALQCESGVVGFFCRHRGCQFASSALMDPMTKSFVAATQRFAQDHDVPVIQFQKGQRKDDVMKEQLRHFDKSEGVVFIGKAQEKTPVFRTERRRNAETGQRYPWIVRSTAMVNHYYWYCLDRDFGPFFLKFCSYFPYNAKLCLNGHEYAKRQLRQEGIDYKALDNGFVSCADPERLQTICDELGPLQIDNLLRRWLARLPHPYTAQDREAGYRYDLSILQAEFSLTQILDRPLSGRIFFEEIIRENLDIGRPDRVQLVFDRRVTKRTPGRFRTRVLTDGVIPSLHVDYKNSRIKQYFKQVPEVSEIGVRTETTINNTRDFYIGKRLCNLPALRQIGFPANPTSSPSRMPQPRLRGGRRSAAPVEPSRGSQRTTHRGLAHHRSSRAGVVAHSGLLSSAALWFRQSRPARATRSAHRANAHNHHSGENDVRPATPSSPRHDRANPQDPSLPGHWVRIAGRSVLHPRPRSPLPSRRGRAHVQRASGQSRFGQPVRQTRGGNR